MAGTVNVQEIGVKMGFDGSAVDRGLSEVEKKAVVAAKRLGDKFQSIGKAMTIGITAPIVAGAAAAFKAAEEVDASTRTIRVNTGATGRQLKSLEDSMKKVFADVPASLQDVADAISGVNTRLGAVGQPLEVLTKRIVELARLTRTDVNSTVALTTRLFGDWSVKSKDQANALDLLFKATQQTGVGLSELAERTVQYGAPLRALGYSLEEATALLSRFEKEGVYTENVMQGLKIALGYFATEGVKDVRAAFEGLSEQLKNARNDTEAAAIGLKVFGRRAAFDMALAVREGRFEIEEMTKALVGSSETIIDAAKDSKGFSEILKELHNKIVVLLEPLGRDMVKAFEDNKEVLVDFINKLRDVVKWFTDLDPATKKLIGSFVILAATIGPVTLAIGKMIDMWVKFKLLQAANAVSAIGNAAATSATQITGLSGAIGTLGNTIKAAGLLRLLGIGGLVAGVGYMAYEGLKNANTHLARVNQEAIDKAARVPLPPQSITVQDQFAGLLGGQGRLPGQQQRKGLVDLTPMSLGDLVRPMVQRAKAQAPKVTPKPPNGGNGGNGGGVSGGGGGGAAGPSPLAEAYARTLESLNREIFLNGDVSERAALMYEMARGSLKGLNEEQKKKLLTLVSVREKQEAATKSALEAAKAEEAFKAQLGTGIPGGKLGWLGPAIETIKKSMQETTEQVVEGFTRQTAMLGMTTERERALWETQEGRYRFLSEAQKSEIVAAAQALDQKNEQIEAERIYQESLAKGVGKGLWRNVMESVLKLKQAQLDAQKTKFDEYIRELTLDLQILNSESTEAALRLQLVASGMSEEQAEKAAEFKQYVERVREMREEIKGLAESVSDQFLRMFERLFDDGFSNFFNNVISGFREMLAQIAADYLKSYLYKLIFNFAMGALGGATGGAGGGGGGGGGSGGGGGWHAPMLAAGGYVGGGRPYIVGEAGPELFVPDTGGTVISNSDLQKVLNQQTTRGGTVVNMTVVTQDAGSFSRSQGQILADMQRALNRSARRNG